MIYGTEHALVKSNPNFMISFVIACLTQSRSQINLFLVKCKVSDWSNINWPYNWCNVHFLHFFPFLYLITLFYHNWHKICYLKTFWLSEKVKFEDFSELPYECKKWWKKWKIVKNRVFSIISISAYWAHFVLHTFKKTVKKKYSMLEILSYFPVKNFNLF